MDSEKTYDIIVIGAGHAGCEAAAVSAVMGANTLLVTIDMAKIGQMPCNPAMGGIAKGQILREIDALGGFSGIVTDLSMIQFRMLNKSKGPAVWSPRAQCDRVLYTLKWRSILEGLNGLDIWQDSVNELLLKENRVYGVKTKIGATFYGKTVIITTGTFEKGLIHVGRKSFAGGRISEPESEGISAQLKNAGISVGRMKTGTPARLNGKTINFNVLEEQKGDKDVRRFSYLETKISEKQRSCYVTYTNENVHEILKEGFIDSPLYNGIIKGIGPRYCPSIEDKIVTFSDKEKHQLFLEPEGWETNEYYINGFSSSLPLEIQYRAIRKIKGLENVSIYRPGYAIEYDYYPPVQLFATLESKYIECLYFAGQVNGTTGYEEAAAQGLMAGINAVNKVRNQKPVILRRDQAYIGVLIDDLISKGVDEPYRMFTSRAEYRILLRQDNADERLTPLAIELGLASEEREKIFIKKREFKNKLLEFFMETSVAPDDINPLLLKLKSSQIKQKVKLIDILLRPEVSIHNLSELYKENRLFDMQEFYKEEVLESVEIDIKYKGYIEREKILAEKLMRLDNLKLDKGLDYNLLKSISTEGRQKLSKVKPDTVGQAMRIPGVSPSDINVLLLYMGR